MNFKIKKVVRRWLHIIRNFRSNHIDNFYFIHINKTGGSSIKKTLKLPFCHYTAQESINKFGIKEWERRFTFTAVRNPWDKVVSQYHYRIKINKSNLRNKPIKFNDWIKLTFVDQDPFYLNNPKMFMPQTDWISDDTGKILVDFIIRFENLNDDFDKVCKKIGKSGKLKHIKSTKHKHYRDYYDENSKKIIETWFQKDIENFGYRF